MSKPVIFEGRKHLPRVPHKDGKKLCSTCRMWVIESDFSNDKATWDGLRPDCRSCASTKRKTASRKLGVRAHDELRTPYNQQGQKWCKSCKQWKLPVQFACDSSKWDGHSVRCKTCDAADQRLRRKQNPGRVRRLARAYQTKKYKQDIQYRLRTTCKNRIWWALQNVGDKSAHTVDLIGCSMDELKVHLEHQFTEGMTWFNYGPTGWHIDHIKPCVSFDLTDPAQQRECFNYKNLQPLWARDNFTKGAKLLHQFL